MTDPTESIKKLSETLKKNNIHCILVGGFAVNAYQFSRATKDIDFLINENDLNKVKELMVQAGFKVEVEGVENLFTRFKNDQIPFEAIDFLLVEPETFNALEKSSKTTLLFGQQFLIPSLLHLIALKLHALKQGQSHRYHKDMLDVLELIRINKIDFKSTDFKELCVKFGSTEIYEKILSMTK